MIHTQSNAKFQKLVIKKEKKILQLSYTNNTKIIMMMTIVSKKIQSSNTTNA